MPKTVIDALAAWQPNRRSHLLAATRWRPHPTAPGGAADRAAPAGVRFGEYEVRCPPAYPEIDWTTDRPRTPRPVAVCTLLGYDGDTAECEMSVAGYVVPRAGLPRWVLDAKRVTVGDRFHWVMRDANYVRPDDIDTDIEAGPPGLTAAERRELEQLHADMLRERQRDGGVWEEYTGPGP